MDTKSLIPRRSSGLDPTVLSFTGDVCEEGTITIILILIAFVIFVAVRVALSSATHKKDVKKDQAVAPINRMAKNNILEDILIVPFVPSSLENLVIAIYCAWFIITITMGITRYYEGRWADDFLAQQGPFNTIAAFLGCKGLNMDVITYQWQKPSPSTSGRRGFGFGNRRKTPLEVLCEKNPLECSSDIDFYFAHHLFFGIVWLTFGALQIYLARNGWANNEQVRRKAHKLFGMFVALPAFFCHIAMASAMAWRNPVNQTPFIAAQYFAMISESILLAMQGVWFALEHKREMHMVRMFFCWIQSVAGSGSIRVTSWFLWLVGKFFPLETRILIDRGACQSMAITGYPHLGIPPTDAGSAEYCYKPVFMNLALTDGLIIWLEWIFLCLPITQFDKKDRSATVAKFKTMAILSVLYLLMVFVFDTPDWIIQSIVGIWAFVVKIHTFRMYIASFADDAALPANRNLLVDLIEQESNWHTLQRVAKIALLKMYMIEPMDEDDDVLEGDNNDADDAANNHLHEE